MPQIQQVNIISIPLPKFTATSSICIRSLIFRLLNAMDVRQYHLQCNIAELSSFKEVKERAVKILPSLICFKYKDVIFTITVGRPRLLLLLLLPPFSLYQMLFRLLWNHGF